MLPSRLPADINLMVFTEMSPFLSAEILKCHWKQGGKFKTVHCGHPEFKAPWWPASWPWDTITKCFSNMRKADYTGPEGTNLTEGLRMTLRNLLEYHSIIPENYVSKVRNNKLCVLT